MGGGQMARADELTIEDALSKLATRAGQNKLFQYRPYDWQMRFHNDRSSERMLMAANRVGKTFSAAAEVGYHATGLYPDWWQGRKFDRPIKAWTGAPTNELSRDVVQAELTGGTWKSDGWGTGSIPADYLCPNPSLRQCGIKDVIEQFYVRHESGGKSQVTLKTYEQGWKRWQGQAPDLVWMDEEPDDYMIFSEAETRVLSKQGLIMVTFTPLSGVTELVSHFMEGGPGIFMINVGWDQAPHLDETVREELRQRYRAHERDARTKGTPMLGEGAIFPFPEEGLRIPPFQIPDFWMRIKGLDFGGMDHPMAGVELAWDQANDVIYVIAAYKSQGQAALHAAWFNQVRPWVPVAWPHDGLNRESKGGKQLADTFRELKVNLLATQAHYEGGYGEKPKMGPQPIEPIIHDVYNRMSSGRFKVFTNLEEWFEEYRSFHRKNGKVVDKRDDLMKATLYGVMMRRYGMSESMAVRPRRQKMSAGIRV
jgi:phage terminase large subunit-like protein